MALPTHNDYSQYSEEELLEHRRMFPNHSHSMIVLFYLDQWRKTKDEQTRKERHEENQSLGQRTLFWAKIGGIAAVIGTTAVLLKDCSPSKILRAMSSQETPTPSPQALLTASPLPTPTATGSPSESPQASLTPVETASPAP